MQNINHDLVVAERRGWALAHTARIGRGDTWLVEACGGEDGRALLAAARWADRLGARVEVAPARPDADDEAFFILADGARRLGLAAHTDADCLENRLRVIDGAGVEREVAAIPPPDAAWRTPLAAARPFVAEAGLESPIMGCARCRDVDRKAIEEFGVPGVCLMENAAVAAAIVAVDMLADNDGAQPVMAVVGAGNNGGDALAVLRGLWDLDIWAEAALLRSPEGFTGDMAVNYRLLREHTGVTVHDIHDRPGELDKLLADSPLLIDGLLGTGFRGGLSPHYRTAIEAINRSGRPTLALDLPSGLNGDDGAVAEAAVRANRTVTFAAVKIGLTVGEGPAHSGRLYLGDIGAPSAALE